MRLPWPFGRRTPASGPPAAGSAGSTPGPWDRASSPPATARPTGAWATLPPIQRTVGAAPLVAPSAPFLGDIPGHRPLPPILEPLGHEVGPSGLPGLVVAHPHAVPVLTSHADLPGRPVQRRASRGGAGDAPAPEPLAAPPAESAAASDTGAPANLAVAVASTAGSSAMDSAPDLQPVRHLASVASTSAVTPPARPLTRTTSLAPVGRPTLARSSGAGAAPVAPASRGLSAPGPQPAAPGTHRPGQTIGPDTTRAHAGDRWTDTRPDGTASGPVSASPAPMWPASTQETAPRRGAREAPPATDRALPGPDRLGGSRRLGLGAPIPGQPASAVAQRMPMRTPRTRVPDGDTGVAAASATTSAEAQQGGPALDGRPDPNDASPTTPSRVAPAPLPVLPVAGRSSPAPARTMPPSAVPAAPASLPHTTRPTLGLRPLRPAVSAQRERADHPSPGAAGAMGAVRPVSARWATTNELPTVVASLPTPAGSEAARSSARLVPVVAQPMDAAGPAGAAGGVREISFPPRDGAASAMPPPASAGTGAGRWDPGSGAGRPDRGSGAAGGVPTATPAGSEGGPSGPARPSRPGGGDHRAPLTLARSVAAAGSGGAPGPSMAAAPVVARIMADPVSASAPPTVQTSTSGGGGGLPVASIIATPVVQRVEGAAPPAETDHGGHSDAELDELARALFGRIHSHLRAEVIHEREAKGLTFDAF